MVRTRLARLESALMRARRGWRCTTCGAPPGGVAKIPMVMIGDDRTDLRPFGPDGRCPRCGAEPPHVVRVVTQLLPGESAASLPWKGVSRHE